MSTTPALDFIVFYVADIEEASRFFTETLGLKTDPAQESPWFRGFPGGEGSIPFGISLVGEEASPEARRPGDIEIYFATNKLDELHATMTEKGARPTAIAHRPFGSIFSVPTPDGHLVTLLRPPSQD